MSSIKKADLEWSKLGFAYIKTDKRYLSHWKGGSWDNGKMIEDNMITIHEGSTVLHYAQECFEGLKAFTSKDDRIFVFRPDQNSKRLNTSADALMMPEVPEDKFLSAVFDVVKENIRWIPPYGHGASFYLRPFLFGVGENMGVRPAPEYIFSVFGSPVGPYFKGGFKPVKFMVSDYDRAAPHGTGSVKAGGNYAASLKAHEIAVKAGFQDAIYLDPATHTKIEEVGAANFFGITKDNKFITPKSSSILPSITKYSLMFLAENYLGMKVEERDVIADNLDEFAEAGACGTAAVITPIGGIFHKNKLHTFYKDGLEVGPVTQKLYDTLTGIQTGMVQAPKDWLYEVNI